VDVDDPGRVISVFPVPFADNFLINGLDPSKKYEAILVNTQGNKVYSTTIHNRSSYQVNTGRLPAGVYTLQLRKDKKEPGFCQAGKTVRGSTQRIIIQARAQAGFFLRAKLITSHFELI
jgi:hypothetical protein